MYWIPDNYPVSWYYPAFFVMSGIRPDNDSNLAGYWIITELDLLGNIIGKEKTGSVIYQQF